MDHVAKYRVLAIQLGLWREADVELAAVAAALRIHTIRQTRRRHGAFGMLAPNLGRQSVARSASADVGSIFLFAQRIPHLHERAREGPMNCAAVVESISREFLEIFDGSGRGIRVERDCGGPASTPCSGRAGCSRSIRGS